LKESLVKLFRDTARGMTRHNFLVWCTLSFLFPVFTFFITAVTSQLPSPEIMILTLDFAADALVIGIPLFLGAGFIFTSSPARQSFVTYVTNSEKSLKLLCAKLVLLIMIMITYLMILIGIGFLRYSAYSTTSNPDTSFIPGFSMASIIITILLTPIAALFSLSLDNWRLTTIIGGGLFFTLTLMSGITNSPVPFVEVAFLGPVQLYRGLAVILGGVKFPTSTSMVTYFGLYFTTYSLVIPLAVYGIIGIVALYGSSILIKKNIEIWKTVQMTEELPFENLSRTLTKSKMVGAGRKSQAIWVELKKRRQFTAALVLILFISLPIASFSYTVYRRQSSEVVVYKSPSGGITLSIEQWYYGTFEATRPDPGVSRMIAYRLRILEWGDLPNRMKFVYHCWANTISEFEERIGNGELDNYSSGSPIERPNYDFDSGWCGLSGEWGTQVWAIRFIGLNRNITAGSLKISLTVTIEDIRI
jgi:hypothetical protein